MKRKSQLHINVMLYIVTGVVVLLLVVFGLNTFASFRERERKTVAVELKEEIKASIETIAAKVGSVIDGSFDLPSGTKDVCIFDLDKRDQILKSPILDRYPIMKNSISSNAKKNIFLIVKGKVWDSMYTGDICFDHYPYYLCYKTSKPRLDLTFEGKGSCALIKEEFRKTASSGINENGKLTDNIQIESLAQDLTLEISSDAVITAQAAVDSDSDGISDSQERALGQDPFDSDSDSDGIIDGDEILLGTDPQNPDSDGDTFADGAEVNSGTDPNDADSKPTDVENGGAGDGMDDEWEVRFSLSPSVDDSNGDLDGDGLTNEEEYMYGTNPLKDDTDDDANYDTNDYFEVNSGLNPLNPDTDGDGIPDGREIDYWITQGFSIVEAVVYINNPDVDGDGVFDGGEISSGTDPFNPAETPADTNENGMDDSWEAVNSVTEPYADPDGDGLTNFEEYIAGTDPQSEDSDGDGFVDGAEITSGSDPMDDDDDAPDDTDGDGMDNYWEVLYGLNTVANDANADPDRDGLSNIEEYIQGTNPVVADSDYDGIPDGIEVNLFNTDPTDRDTDDDGIDDLWDVTQSVIDPYADSDEDGLTNLEEYIFGTDPLVADSDGDTFDDGAEVTSGTNPMITTETPADTNGNGIDDSWEDIYIAEEPSVVNPSADSDSDGLTNLEEYIQETDPTSQDTDADGITDMEEIVVYHTDPADSDTDNDGISDGVELAGGTDPLDIPTSLGEEITSLEICLEPVETPMPGAYLSEVYSVSSCGGPEIEFSEPISVTMAYYPELIPVGFSAQYLKIKYYDTTEGEWVKLPTVNIDESEDLITSSMTKLAMTAVFGPDPPTAVISSPLAPAIFMEDVEINFDGSASFDLDDDPITFSWDFGDGATSSQMVTTHTYAQPGNYNARLTVNDGFSDDIKEIVMHINSDNRKNDVKYTAGMIFLVPDNDWRSIVRMIPLTIWNKGEAEPERYPLFAYYEKTGFNIAKLNDILLEYSSGNVVFVDAVPVGVISDPRTSSMNMVSDYFSYWESYYNNVVVIGYDNQEGALIAGLYASFLNAPLIMVNDANLDDYKSQIEHKNVYIVDIDTVDVSVTSYISTNAQSSMDYTSETLKTNVGVNPYAILNADVFVAE